MSGKAEKCVDLVNNIIENGEKTLIFTQYKEMGNILSTIIQNELNVYGKKGESCKVCNTPIEKIVVGGRGTHYCPNCQKG